MYKVLLCVVFLSFIYLFPSGQQPGSSAYKNTYKYAEGLYYDRNPTNLKDSLALKSYLKVIALHHTAADSILFDSYYKAGIYHQTSGDFEGAIPFLRRAVDVHAQVRSLSDSLLFLPLLYLGNSYYNISLLDSASLYYSRSEKIANKYPELPGLERLYNASGAVSYESGNFQRSSIYFEKALHTLNKRNIPLEVTYLNNIAASWRKMGDYDKAMSIYRDLLRYNSNRHELLHNIGSMYLERDSIEKAVFYLRSGDTNDPDNLNDLALAYFKLNQLDSSLFYIRRSLVANEHLHAGQKNISLAVTHRMYGDMLLTKNIDAALVEYQEGICQLIFSFNEKNIRDNPERFEGQFSVTELFELLRAKSKAFALRYEHTKDTSDLSSSLNTYDALYSFTEYVLRTYESPEARQYLSSRRNLTHNEPFEISLKLYSLTGKRQYIEKAFRYDEQGKAAVLSLALAESGIKENGAIPDSLQRQEKQLKQQITRLSIQAASATDSLQNEKLRTIIRDTHIQLDGLQNSFNKYPAFRAFRMSQITVSYDSIRRSIPSNTAIFSYHLSDTSVTCFILTGKELTHFSTGTPGSFAKQIIQFNKLVSHLDENNQTETDSLSKHFYQKLIAPAEAAIKHIDHLVIIPDDELNILPFEILKNSNGKYLVEKHDLTYNYSCSILRPAVDGLSPMLGMAPFISAGGPLPALKQSAEEINALQGDRLMGNKATKSVFVAKASQYKTLHLATHAVADDLDPAGSYIAFYPEKDSIYKLYASEIVDLPLNKTNLVVLSACETGSGKLVRGEGILSLTRAFAYAGCPNTIASLWKADDASTSYILRRFYAHLEDNVSPSVALQTAIKNYLDDGTIPGRLKTPGYWAHLRFVGNFGRDTSGHLLLINLIAVIGMIAIVLIYRKAIVRGTGTRR